MPELPEVETTRRGIEPHAVGRRIAEGTRPTIVAGLVRLDGHQRLASRSGVFEVFVTDRSGVLMAHPDSRRVSLAGDVGVHQVEQQRVGEAQFQERPQHLRRVSRGPSAGVVGHVGQHDRVTPLALPLGQPCADSKRLFVPALAALPNMLVARST